MDYQKRLIPTGTLRLVFLIAALWDILGGVAGLSFSGPLLDIKDTPSGILAARPFGSALFVIALLYLIAARDPLRHRFILWLAVLEQLIAIVIGVYQGASDNLKWEGLVIPVGMAIILLVLFLLNYPRARVEEFAPVTDEDSGESAPREH